MKNEFWSFVKFGKADNANNFNRINQSYAALPVKSKDFWRFLIPQSDFMGESVDNLEIVLLNNK
ncbi:hypothetical protein ACFFJX_12670 [Pseudarcicella hirudinis]